MAGHEKESRSVLVSRSPIPSRADNFLHAVALVLIKEFSSRLDMVYLIHDLFDLFTNSIKDPLANEHGIMLPLKVFSNLFSTPTGLEMVKGEIRVVRPF